MGGFWYRREPVAGAASPPAAQVEHYCWSPIEVTMGEQLAPVPISVSDEFRPHFVGRNPLGKGI